MWALTAAYWLHLLATVAWVGGIFTMAILVLPSARKALDREQYPKLLSELTARLQRVGWFSLLVLFGTGMFQMISHPSYSGFLVMGNTWAWAILLKHLSIGGMVLTSAYITWGLLPRMERLSLLQAAGREVQAGEKARLAQRETAMLYANIALSIVVLALTAVARAS